MTDIDVLLHSIEVPDTDPADDVRRGEQALRRRHRWQVGAAAASVAAVGVAGFALHASSGSPGAAPPYVGRPSSQGTASTAAPPTVKPHRHHGGRAESRAERRLNRIMDAGLDMPVLRTYHDVLAEHLDPTGTQLRLAQNQQGGGGSFGTKLDWKDGGMLEIVVGTSWDAVGGYIGLGGTHMTPTTFHGQPARVSTTGGDLVVSVRHDDGTIVSLFASTTFGNNGTSTPSLGLTQHQLLEAAADPRLQLPPGV